MAKSCRMVCAGLGSGKFTCAASSEGMAVSNRQTGKILLNIVWRFIFLFKLTDKINAVLPVNKRKLGGRGSLEMFNLFWIKKFMGAYLVCITFLYLPYQRLG